MFATKFFLANTLSAPLFELLHSIGNPNAFGSAVDDYFGFSVDIDGDYAIVAAPRENDLDGVQSGKVYIFNASTGALVHTIDNPNAYGDSETDRFGEAVAISGNYAIVGAENEDESGAGSAGKAYIFNVVTGALVHTIDNPNAYGSGFLDLFGSSVDISGDYAIVGAEREDDASGPNYGGNDSGKAYIFNVATGALVHTLDNPNAYGADPEDYFGGSVGISGDYAIVGAWRENDATGIESGKAYIFNVSTGGLLHTLNNPNPDSDGDYDRFGRSVAISGNYAIVGASEEDDPGNDFNSGKAYIYNVITGQLVHTLDNPNAYGIAQADYFGRSVSIHGNYAVVGAIGEKDAGGSSSGKAYIFDVSTGKLLQTLDNPNIYGTSAADVFGGSVAIKDNYVVVGAYRETDASDNEYSGAAYIYKLI